MSKKNKKKKRDEKQEDNKNEIKLQKRENDWEIITPPILRFSPTAWAKLCYLRDLGDTEVGGFGITLQDDPFYVDDFFLPKQTCSYVTTKFDDESVANYLDDYVDQDYQPNQLMRVWIHTHPANSPTPSSQDEQTFATAFGSCDYAIMFILAREGNISCRLKIMKPVQVSMEIKTSIDFNGYDFEASDHTAWFEEYSEKVIQEKFVFPKKQIHYGSTSQFLNKKDDYSDYRFMDEAYSFGNQSHVGDLFGHDSEGEIIEDEGKKYLDKGYGDLIPLDDQGNLLEENDPVIKMLAEVESLDAISRDDFIDILRERYENEE